MSGFNSSDSDLLRHIALYSATDKPAYMFSNMKRINSRLNENNPFAYAMMLQNPTLTESEKSIILCKAKSILEQEYNEVEKIKRECIEDEPQHDIQRNEDNHTD